MLSTESLWIQFLCSTKAIVNEVDSVAIFPEASQGGEWIERLLCLENYLTELDVSADFGTAQGLHLLGLMHQNGRCD